jgi:SAM-dependent methyltransferase
VPTKLFLLGRVFAANLAAAALAAKADAPVFVPYDEAKPVLAAHKDLPPKGGSYLQISPKEWPAWIAKRDAEIRARLARGDEDSLVYLWLYGTSFTKRPRATEQDIARLGDRAKAEALLIDRLDDLVAGLSAPGSNERLQFGRAVLARNGIDVAAASGTTKALAFLVKARERVLAENAQIARSAATARQSGAASAMEYATLFRDRGLSSDTRLTAAFAVDRALAAVAEARALPASGVRRVAVVGPGLDFTDKAEGFDFYPQQTIQPFGVIDSLRRLALAKTDDFRLTTFDLSPRVNGHLANAAKRGAAGVPYTIQLPLPADDPKHDWQPELLAYWKTFGGGIGRETRPAPLPAGMPGVRVRGVAVSPIIAAAIAPHDLNIIVQRQPLPDSERFDLVVATNILVYYDAFDQALALTNIASMLRPGGLFLSNYAVVPSATMEALPALTTRVFFDKQQNGDTVFVYRRR